jgi:membrane protein DedA with SNARE-associated domain
MRGITDISSARSLSLFLLAFSFDWARCSDDRWRFLLLIVIVILFVFFVLGVVVRVLRRKTHNSDKAQLD